MMLVTCVCASGFVWCQHCNGASRGSDSKSECSSWMDVDLAACGHALARVRRSRGVRRVRRHGIYRRGRHRGSRSERSLLQIIVVYVLRLKGRMTSERAGRRAPATWSNTPASVGYLTKHA